MGGWNNHVDRAGMLLSLGLPAAWKGSRPKVIYVWTGDDWYRVRPKKIPLDPAKTLKVASDELTRVMNLGGGYFPDEEQWARQVAAWGYTWAGQL